ncbi:MAG: glycine cleavage system protein R [Gammaproteobacteria bacterium]|nr:glycine cleavage system protein R [Gammaproteobacteria bacterium]
MNKELVLSALGTDQPGLVDRISKHILNLNLNIEDSRMSILGGEFAIMLLLSGNEEILQSLIDSIPELEQEFSDLVFNSKYTERKARHSGLSYKVKIHALDHQGIVHHLARFFSARNINIEELSTSSYAAPHTGSKMFTVDLKLYIPEGTSLSQLRDAFIQHCDDLNLDASFEPVSAS